MKHTDFFSIIKRIKVRELKEIVAALRLHGGAYEWTDVCDSPMIAADTGGGLMDAAVLRAVLGKDGLQLECADTSNGECMTIMPHDVFAGHLSYITDKVPPINGTGDVTAPKEYFAIAWIGREDIAAKGYVEVTAATAGGHRYRIVTATGVVFTHGYEWLISEGLAVRKAVEAIEGDEPWPGDGKYASPEFLAERGVKKILRVKYGPENRYRVEFKDREPLDYVNAGTMRKLRYLV